MPHNRQPGRSAASEAKHGRNYTRQPNDLITARECVQLIDERVVQLLDAHERLRGDRRWWRRLLARLRR